MTLFPNTEPRIDRYMNKTSLKDEIPQALIIFKHSFSYLFIIFFIENLINSYNDVRR